MAINVPVQKICKEEEVGFVDLFGCFAGRANVYMGGRHLIGKGAAGFADELSASVVSGMDSITTIFGSGTGFNYNCN